MAKKFQIITRSAPFLLDSHNDAELASELLYGEIVETLGHKGDFLHCKNLIDDYEGYVAKSHLSDEIIDATHKVIRIHSFIYAEPDYKSGAITYLSFFSGLALSGERENGFAEIEGGGWIWEDDLAPINHHAENIATTAEMFLNLPYLWGGKTSRGIDCSGLVQLSLQHSGLKCPRDSGDQRKASFGKVVDITDPYAPENLQGGDLVFFKGHVGIMNNESEIINATARKMAVVKENLNDIAQYYDGGILAIKRLK
jgi:cell wall-associated NlpC family hydrolase